LLPHSDKMQTIWPKQMNLEIHLQTMSCHRSLTISRVLLWVKRLLDSTYNLLAIPHWFPCLQVAIPVCDLTSIKSSICITFFWILPSSFYSSLHSFHDCITTGSPNCFSSVIMLPQSSPSSSWP
jgi:hypothetical protein